MNHNGDSQMNTACGIRVAVCDDSPADTAYLSRLVTEWAAGKPVCIQTFLSAEAFLFHHEDEKFDILLLDIEMGKTDGISLAKTIRKRNDPVQIIFVTGYPDHMSEGYDVSALHYLLKPVQKEKLFAVLDRAGENLGHVRESALFETADGLTRLYLDDIICIEAFLHACELTAASGVYRLNEPISKLEERLGGGFVRCHRSYLVNLIYISQLTRNSVMLDNGRALPLSRRLSADVSRRFVSYYIGEPDEP